MRARARAEAAIAWHVKNRGTQPTAEMLRKWATTYAETASVLIQMAGEMSGTRRKRQRVSGSDCDDCLVDDE